MAGKKKGLYTYSSIKEKEVEMKNTIKIKVPTDTIIELMIAVNDRIKQNREQMLINREIGKSKNNKKFIKANRNLNKIHKALAGIQPILIKEVF